VRHLIGDHNDQDLLQVILSSTTTTEQKYEALDERTKRQNIKLRESEKYNGWKNRETWLVGLWFGDIFDNNDGDGETWDADQIKEWVTDYVHEQTENIGGFIGDLIDVSQIDWRELANHYKTV